jgi:hypothetical protein
MTEKWQTTITETYGLVQRIDERTANTDKKVEVLFDKVDNHEGRIQTLETHEAVEEEKEKWIQRNPIKTGIGIGGVSFATLVGIAVAALKYLGVL